MAITPLPNPPTRSMTSDAFASTADVFFGALPNFVTEANATQTDVNTKQSSAASSETASLTSSNNSAASATASAASAQSAISASGAAKWVSGTTYAEGAVVWSPTNYLSYRRKVAGDGVVDPISNTTNWAQIQNDYNVTINPKAMSQGVAFVGSTSTTPTNISDNANLDVGVGNFTIRAKVVMPASGASVYICFKRSGLSPNCIGYLAAIHTDGKLRLNIGRNDASTDYYSTTALSNTPGTVVEVVIVVTRETATSVGIILYYVNGNQLGSYVAITSGTPYNLDNTNDFCIHGAYTPGGVQTTSAGVMQSFCLYNRALSAADVLSLYRNGIDESDKDGSQTASYTSDFSAGANGWTGFRATVAGNIDGIGGQNDTLRTYASADNASHQTYINSLTASGKRYLVSLSYYIPSTNTSLKRIGFTNKYSDSTSSIVTIGNALDTWATLQGEFYVDSTTPQFFIFSASASSWAYIGANSATDDLFYIKNVTFTPIGTVLRLEHEGIQPNQWLDSSANKLHATYPTSGSSLVRMKPTGKYNWTTAITGDTTLTSIVPAGYELEKIVFKNSTVNAVSVRLGTTAGGTDVFGLTALNTSATLGGYKTVMCNQAFSATAAQTLYLSSTDWSANPSLTMNLFFKRF